MVSIIIPTYNEENRIKKLLAAIIKTGSQIIISDCGSNDRTLAIASGFENIEIVFAPKGKAKQMNSAAKSAKGDILLFLHADCILEEGAIKSITECIKSGYDGGCLSQRISSPELVFRFIEGSGNLRAKIFRIFYGDQAIFVKKDVFFELGGYDQVDIFEDVIFSKKLRKNHKVCILKSRVYSSARRWKKQGIIRTTIINWALTFGFIIGIPRPLLKKLYVDIR
jgi:rSAM/selenodomain-associated transferase 2